MSHIKNEFLDYFFGIETFKKDLDFSDKFLDGFVGKIIPTLITCSGIAYGFYSKDPHTPGNIVLASELFRLMYHKISSRVI